MQLNTDFTERTVLRPDERTWQPSPAAGVERQMLYRQLFGLGHPRALPAGQQLCRACP